MALTESIKDAWENAAAAAVAYAPGILLGILIIVVGWMAARLSRSAVRRVVAGSNRLLQNLWQRKSLPGLPVIPRVGGLLANLVFILVLALAVLIAFDVAGFDSAVDWLRRAATYLPNALAGIIIILLGYPLGVLIRELIAQPGTDGSFARSRDLARYAQYAVVIIAAIVGLDQMGLDVQLLVALVTVVVAALAISFSVTFAASARSHVRNLIGARVARRELSAGQSVRVGGVAGTVLEITPTHIALETADGRAFVPASTFDDHVVEIVGDDARGTADG